MGELSIRRATADEVAALAALIVGFRDHVGAASPGDRDLARVLPELLAATDLEFCCAWLAGRPVGYTQTRFLYSLWSLGTEAHLEDLFVVPEARGRHVGRALLRHAMSRARERDARRLTLTTNEQNQASQALYRSEGLVEQGDPLYAGGREILWARELDG